MNSQTLEGAYRGLNVAARQRSQMEPMTGLTATESVQQLRDRSELDRELERQEKAASHVLSLVGQLEMRLASVVVPRPESAGNAAGIEGGPGSAVGQMVRANTFTVEAACQRLLLLMESLAV